jgi:carbamoyl-phosphate synthase/aspartate carbamoyltransferase
LNSTGGATPFYRKHILSVKQFTRYDLHALFGLAHEMRTMVERVGSSDLLQGRVLCNLFYEPSTRTSSSFEAAMLRLGGKVVSVKGDTSSVAKGESLQDTGKLHESPLCRHVRFFEPHAAAFF